MGEIPTWLGAVGALFVLASVLGAAVAVYRTSVYGTSLKESDSTVNRLRGEIADYLRRETELVGEVRVLETEGQACRERVTVLEDLLTHRQDDDAIRAEIAAVRKVVDENVMIQLTTILTAIERVEKRDAR